MHGRCLEGALSGGGDGALRRCPVTLSGRQYPCAPIRLRPPRRIFKYPVPKILNMIDPLPIGIVDDDDDGDRGGGGGGDEELPPSPPPQRRQEPTQEDDPMAQGAFDDDHFATQEWHEAIPVAAGRRHGGGGEAGGDEEGDGDREARNTDPFRNLSHSAPARCPLTPHTEPYRG